MSSNPEVLVGRWPESEAPRPPRLLDCIAAADLDDSEQTFDDELIEGTIARGSMAVLYGDSNSGKTFAAIDLGAAIGRGVPWLGRNCDTGLVVYLATEASGSVIRRLRAYQRHHGRKATNFVIVKSPINLFENREDDLTAVLALADELEAQYGMKIALFIGDTLAKISAGANENSGEMGIVLRNADKIRAATGAAFLWIHHSGKNAAQGARGWSGIRGAIETEIEVVADDATGTHTLEVMKQRDLPGKGDRIGFRLEFVDLGVNRWGTRRGSCVVVAADAPAKPARGKRPSEIAGAIAEYLSQRGTGCLRGALAKHFEGRYVRQSVYREITKMIDSGALITSAGVVALPGAPGPKP